MVSLTAVALGVSFLTTSLLTFHDTLKQVEHAKGFATFLLTQDIQTNAQYALTCVTTAIEERVATRGEQIRKNIFTASSDFVNQSINVLQAEVDKKLKKLSMANLMNYVREEEQKIVMEQQAEAPALTNAAQSSPDAQSSLGLWDRISWAKNSIANEIQKELEFYRCVRRQKQREALFYLYDMYKESQGIKSSKWITPFNIIMMVALGIGSFFFPKLVIGLAVSYFLSCEVYLLSDTLATATQWDGFTNLNFNRVFQFHMMIFTAAFGYERYHLYKGRNSPGDKLKFKGLSVSY